MATLAERLNAWFADAATADAVGRLREPTTSEVAQAISQDPSHDVTISRSYLTALRNGSQTNPTVSVLSAIVRYFQSREMTLPVSVSALISEADPPTAVQEEKDEWAEALSDRQVRSIAMRAGQLTPAMREQLLSIMDVLDDPKKSAKAAPEEGDA
jgi:transcriptional regulator with XRE-family HTH domain